MSKEKENRDLSNIVAVLKYGAFFGVSRRKIVLEYIILVILLAGLSAVAVTMMSIEQVNNPGNVGAFVGAIIAYILGFSFILILCLIIILRNEKIRKDVLLWVIDSVELEAYVKTIDKKSWLGITPLIKVEVDFEMNGTHFTRTSEVETQSLFNWGKPLGYLSGISKYVDRKVKILYSQHYDQVMILKD